MSSEILASNYLNHPQVLLKLLVIIRSEGQRLTIQANVWEWKWSISINVYQVDLGFRAFTFKISKMWHHVLNVFDSCWAEFMIVNINYLMNASVFSWQQSAWKPQMTRDENAEDCMRWQNKKQMYKQCTVSLISVSCHPTEFSARQIYFPSSDICTRSIRKTPSSRITDLLERKKIYQKFLWNGKEVLNLCLHAWFWKLSPAFKQNQGLQLNYMATSG